ncbi:radical SAM protein [Streptomyces bobili]
MSRLSHAEINKIRQTPQASVLFFITDRCPVGCAHCSVDSRPDSSRVTDFELFADIVDQLCANPRITMVGISGGEPFVERRALTLAAQRLVDVGKSIVIYTSGIWAGASEPPSWINQVLARTACVYLSTDAFHEEGASARHFVNAAKIVACHDVPIIVQVIDENGMLERAQELLTLAFGNSWMDYAEIVPTFGLPHGRGASLYAWSNDIRGKDLGACGAVTSPVIRYDGRVTACCNETVVMGGGPRNLRRDCKSGAEVSSAVAEFRSDPFCRALATVGIGVLATHHPTYLDLADRQFSSICGACWAMVRRKRDAAYEPLLTALGAVSKEENS